MQDKSYNHQPTLRSRHLRNGATDAERVLWSVISNRQIAGVRFNRQVPVGPFICDFVARSAKLVVELDGGQHGDAVAYDDRRTDFLQARGYRVLRYWNNDVFSNLAGVVEAINDALDLSPSAGSRGAACQKQARAGGVNSLQQALPFAASRLSPPAPAGGGKQDDS